MSYYQLLNLKKEPFSSSPDPLFLYHSRECHNFLSKLELTIRLRRGLNVLVGDIGTGKTTIGRSLLKLFEGEKENFLFHLILDPSFESGMEFLAFLLYTFSIPVPAESSPVAYKNAIQNFLFDKGVKENKTIVLIIDEAQKLVPTSMEILRELLNFETNEYKLLQLVLLGQMELMEKIRQQPNLMDRINACFILHPMNRSETEAMINHRLAIAGLQALPKLFTRGALDAIYRATRGYPRKIVFLCHHALIRMLIQKKNQIDRATIRNVLQMRSSLRKKPSRFPARPAVIATTLMFCFAVILFFLISRSPSGLIFPLFKAQALHSSAKSAVQEAPVISTSVSHSSVSESSILKSTPSTVEPSTQNTLLRVKQIKDSHQQIVISSASGQAQAQKEPSDTKTRKADSEPSALSLRSNKSMSFSHSPDMSTQEETSEDIVWVVKRGDNLYSLARRIYGRADREVLRLIQRNNPDLTDINNLRIGQTIRFPNISSEPI